MNFDVVYAKPIRIMWSQRDPAMRRSGAGNIFIKNLDKGIDNKAIYDTFSTFGNILSCKVAQDEEAHSKGYGFVHFETEKAAQEAIDKVNGMLLENKKVYVGKFLPRSARLREMGETARRFTNVFVKNFGDELDQDKLQTLFSKFGPISSTCVMTDAEGKSRGFGFVAFDNPEDAERAVNEMHESHLPDSERKLHVCRAQKRSERLAELKRKYEQQKVERIQRFQGVNLYVKNLDDSVDDDILRASFDPFGKITSAKVMCDENGRSKGFGFVCFDKPEEATKAVTEMNGKIISTKPLYVALAQRKEDRKAQLASQYMQRLASIRMHSAGTLPGTMYTPSSGGFFVSQAALQNQRAATFMPTATIPGAQMRGGAAPRWNTMSATPQFGAVQSPYMVTAGYGGSNRQAPRPTGQQTALRPQTAQYQQQQTAARVVSQQQQRMPGMMQQSQPQQQQQRPMQQQQQTVMRIPNTSQQQAMVGAAGNSMFKYSTNARIPQGAPASGYPPSAQQASIVVQGQEPLTAHMLAQAMPQEQKQMLGERIFPLIERMYHGQEAGKITGMMLEMDNSELLMMLESEELLRSKVNEAVSVLHSAKHPEGVL
jgi:polyadenylate-binding protein